MMLRIRLIILFLLIAGLLPAQEARWTAPLPHVPVPGLYAIVLGSEFMGRSRSDLGDVRLLDPAGNEVPYVLQAPEISRGRTVFVPFTVLRNEVLPFRTLIEIERPEDMEMDRMHIRVRPAEVAKHLRVTGSDDGTDWYMVKDEHMVAQGSHGDPPHQVLLVNVPRSDYRYYRITLNDSLTPPMQVLDVGRYVDEDAMAPRRVSTRSLGWVQENGPRDTRIHVWSMHPMAVDQISFSVDGTIPYRRSGIVITWRNPGAGRSNGVRSQRLEQIHGSFVIASDAPNVIDVPGLRADTFMIVIDNGDDRPLRFRNIRASVEQHVMLAQLDAGVRYRLVTGNAKLPSPRYDMVHYLDQLPPPRDTLAHAAPMAMPMASTDLPGFDPEAWWVWAIIIPLIAGMAFMAVKMLRQEEREA
jgi:hypothetical protein